MRLSTVAVASIVLVLLVLGPVSCTNAGAVDKQAVGNDTSAGEVAQPRTDSDQQGVADEGSGGSGEVPENAGVTDEPVSSAGAPEVPEGWPEFIPMPPALDLQSAVENPLGGISLIFSGTGNLADLDAIYRNALAEWSETEPLQIPTMGEETLRLSLYKEKETFELQGSTGGSEGQLVVKLTYNWITPPGETPEGWPEDVPMVPGMEVRYGFVDEVGAFNVIQTGARELNEIGDFYLENLKGWSNDNPRSVVEGGRSVILMFRRGNERLVITADGREDETVVKMRWVKTE